VELKGTQHPSLEIQVLTKMAETLYSKLQSLDPQVEFSTVEYQKFKSKLSQLQLALDRTDGTAISGEKDKTEGDEPVTRGQGQRQQGRKGRYVILEEDIDEPDSARVCLTGSLNHKDVPTRKRGWADNCHR